MFETRLHCFVGGLVCVRSELDQKPSRWCGANVGEGMPAQVSCSSSDSGLKLRGQSQNNTRVALKTSDSLAHSSPPTLPPHTSDLSLVSKDHISLFKSEWDERKSNNIGVPNSPSVYANYHRDFTLTNGFDILCSKKVNWNTGECLA
ncbi:hypothetical protein AVEN_162642-1 [Araneus ventricosus]|uniref:Uncharacterized protein n=1 Tax=Araneus ventricosus TaxID=182803 RepID=A0A4Y2FCA4_ARAVE|nr:hypothetical protein AVEN_162642-1 [Araneus ventricosus]